MVFKAVFVKNIAY